MSGGADPKLALTAPDKVREVTLAVSDLRGQGGPAYGYRLVARPEAGDYTLKLATPYVNVPARGTAAVKVVAERHGYDGPILLSIPGLPSDLTVAGGNIAAEVLDYEGKREPSTVGFVTLTAKQDAKPFSLSPEVLELSLLAEDACWSSKPVGGLKKAVSGFDSHTLPLISERSEMRSQIQLATDETRIQHGNQSVIDPCFIRGRDFGFRISNSSFDFQGQTPKVSSLLVEA